VGRVKDGKAEGFWTHWYENGQKFKETNYKDDRTMTAVAWKPNGEKCPETNIVDGNGVVVIYREDGTEGGRSTYTDGEVEDEAQKEADDYHYYNRGHNDDDDPSTWDNPPEPEDEGVVDARNEYWDTYYDPYWRNG